MVDILGAALAVSELLPLLELKEEPEAMSRLDRVAAEVEQRLSKSR